MGPKDEAAAWDRLLPELRSRGWEIELTCHYAPVQLEGAVPSGELFYYRCRHETCALSIGGDDPVDGYDWMGERTTEGASSASWLPPDDAVRILLDLHDEWLNLRA
ncbi:hypothetical protein [Herbidospora sp. RD11066]